MVSFGELVKDCRIKSGYNMSQLARELSISHTFISQIENDRAIPSEDVIIKMSELFNIDSCELLMKGSRIPKVITDEIEGNDLLFKLLYDVFKNNYSEDKRNGLYEKWMQELYSLAE